MYLFVQFVSFQWLTLLLAHISYIFLPVDVVGNCFLPLNSIIILGRRR